MPTKILSGAQTGADRTALNWGHPPRRPAWRLLRPTTFTTARTARRFKSEAEAAEKLSMALRRYYDDALVRYNLVCYWCVMGRVEEARAMPGDGL